MISIHYFLYEILHSLLIPIKLFFLFTNKKIMKRVLFEGINRKDTFSRSFKKDKIRADFAFEVSSEGEFQQVRTLVEEVLSRGKKVELIYCSESLESTIEKFKNNYDLKQLRALRLPLVTNHFFNNIVNWTTASTMILCRYDFFPDLIYYGKVKAQKFILVAATLKNDKNSNWNNLVYESFDLILTTTNKDKKLFEKKVKAKMIEFDFRILKIAQRQKEGELSLRKSLKNFSELEKVMNQVSKEARFICGSFWPQEAFLFGDNELVEKIKKREILSFIVPHKLDDDHIEEIIKSIKEYSHIPVHLYKDSAVKDFYERFSLEPGVIIVQERGVLVELYPFFEHAYVGGGFGRSVHSLLEPFIGGCQIYCGPKIYRSTEYDVILDKDRTRAQLINEETPISTFFQTEKRQVSSSDVSQDYVEQTKEKFENVLSEIGLT